MAEMALAEELRQVQVQKYELSLKYFYPMSINSLNIALDFSLGASESCPDTAGCRGDEEQQTVAADRKA